MLRSYKQEISRKRRAAVVFWFFVFSLAFFLYFFFQGFYPSLNFTWRHIFESGSVRNLSRDELVKSFGIINIRVEPRDARIQINREDISYDEKKMVAYGDYLLSIGKPGYIQNRINFTIDREIPYYIDRVRLIPRPQYQIYNSPFSAIARVEEDMWYIESYSGAYLLDNSFSGMIRIPRPGRHIGEGFFLTNTNLYRNEEGTWQESSWSGSKDLIQNCRESIKIIGIHLFCPSSNTILRNDGKSYTGVTRIEKNYFIVNGALITKNRDILLSENERNSPFFIEKDGIWYVPSDGNLIPLFDQRNKKGIPLIVTGLDTIRGAFWLEDILFIFGKKGKDSFFTMNHPEISPSLIPFPDIPLEEVRITRHEGNTFFKTRNALLFLYNNSKKVEWITEGEILAVSPIAALYRRDGVVWRASWGE